MPTKTPLRDTIFFRWEQDWGNTFGLQYSSHSLLSITSSKIFCGLKGVVIHRFQFDKAEFVNSSYVYAERFYYHHCNYYYRYYFCYFRYCYYMMTSSNGNIFRVTGPFCGEFTGHRWIPRTKASDAVLWCFLWSAPEPTVEQTMRRWWF